MGPVLDAVRFEPLLGGGRAHKALEISTWMQSLAAPIRGGKQRHVYFGPIRRAALAVFIVERMRQQIGAEIAAIRSKLRVGNRLRPADKISGSAAARSAFAES